MIIYFFFALSGARTHDPGLIRPVLYQLSYKSECVCIGYLEPFLSAKSTYNLHAAIAPTAISIKNIAIIEKKAMLFIS